MAYNWSTLTGRLWMWLAGGAALILIGVQFIVSWIVMRVLAELSQREVKVDLDMRGTGCDIVGKGLQPPLNSPGEGPAKTVDRQQVRNTRGRIDLV